MEVTRQLFLINKTDIWNISNRNTTNEQYQNIAVVKLKKTIYDLNQWHKIIYLYNGVVYKFSEYRQIYLPGGNFNTYHGQLIYQYSEQTVYNMHHSQTMKNQYNSICSISCGQRGVTLTEPSRETIPANYKQALKH